MQDRPSILARIDRALDFVLYHASAALIVLLTGVILYAVVARYFFNAAPSWSEEVPRVLFLWCSYIAVAVAVRRGQSLRVTVLVDKLPPGPRLVLELFMHAAILVMLGYLVWFNVPVIELNATTKMLATQWADSVRYWPLTVGCVLMAIYQLRLAIRSIEDYRAGTAGSA